MDYHATVSKVIAGRVRHDGVIDYSFEQPRFGFYWWFWLPRYQSNGGKFKRQEVVDVSIQWLCFSIGLIFWPCKAIKDGDKPKSKGGACTPDYLNEEI